METLEIGEPSTSGPVQWSSAEGHFPAHYADLVTSSNFGTRGIPLRASWEVPSDEASLSFSAADMPARLVASTQQSPPRDETHSRMHPLRGGSGPALPLSSFPQLPNVPTPSSSLSSFPQFPIVHTSSPSSHYDRHAHQVYGGQGPAPVGALSLTQSLDPKASDYPYVPISSMGGSLVLDGSRGELINIPKMTPQEMLDAKALAASKSHSEAERRRRERINTHLTTLRSLLPSSTKTDKASLLAEVIMHLKDLKRQAAEIGEEASVPTDVDELQVETDPSFGDQLVIRACICCNDRPDLIKDLIKVVNSLQLHTVKAEISTLGGRIKIVLAVTNKTEGAMDGGTHRNLSLETLTNSLRVVVDKEGSWEVSQGSSGSIKRPRLVPVQPPTSLNLRTSDGKA